MAKIEIEFDQPGTYQVYYKNGVAQVEGPKSESNTCDHRIYFTPEAMKRVPWVMADTLGE